MERFLPFRAVPVLAALVLSAGGLAAAPVAGGALEGVSPADARRALVAAAESRLGTAYRYGGTDHRGLDCSGLIVASFRDALDIHVPRTVAALYAWAERIPPAGLVPGDLVFFRTAGREISHAGIYAGDGRFIHSASEGRRTGVIYSRLDEPYWKRAFAGAGRALPHDGGFRPDYGGTAGLSESGRGFFAGLGLSLSWGDFLDGSSPPVRGVSAQLRAGYRGFLHPDNQASLEIRPEWDGALGLFRLPLTIALGTDVVRVFAGPALTLGGPAPDARPYEGFAWLGSVGVSGAVPPIPLGKGHLSFFGELCWQSYTLLPGPPEEGASDPAARLRFSLGLAYSFSLAGPGRPGE